MGFYTWDVHYYNSNSILKPICKKIPNFSWYSKIKQSILYTDAFVKIDLLKEWIGIWISRAARPLGDQSVFVILHTERTEWTKSNTVQKVIYF